MRVDVGFCTDVGRVRDHNEDNFWIDKIHHLYIVADGMGGHAAGEVASDIAVKAIEEVVIAKVAGVRPYDDAAYGKLLQEAVETANRCIFQTTQEQPAKKGMGTTVTALLLRDGRYYMGHVGDSRAYLIRKRDMAQITQDHSHVQHLVDRGIISAEEAEDHPQKNILTRSVGVSEAVQVDTYSGACQEGDRFLICCDGLHGVVKKDNLSRLARQSGSLRDVCQEMVDQANRNGGPDNITAILVEIKGTESKRDATAKTVQLRAIEDDAKPAPATTKTVRRPAIE